MADRPILFSGPMVRALLAGTKTQTRRIIKPQPELQMNGFYHVHNRHGGLVNVAEEDVGREAVDYLRIAVGDRLYVREMWARVPASAYRMSDGVPQTVDPNDSDLAAIYAADWERSKPKWKPSIHMSRWASRLTLTVTDVRVERLQDISREDAKAEGMPVDHNGNYYDPPPPEVDSWQGYERASFFLLWSEINGKRPGGAVADNPWVAAYTFTVHLGNIDQMEADQ